METGDNRELFTSLGLKSTRHRSMIYDILRASELPLTTEEIFLRMKGLDAAVSFSTVYRTLDTFAEKGLAVKGGAGEGGKSAFELNCRGHRHRLVCIGCKRVIPLEDCPLDRYEKSLEKKTRFDITAHRLEIFGYCPACKANIHNNT
jgi:Fur family transcriptional regulator, ferric uptake regulator